MPSRKHEQDRAISEFIREIGATDPDLLLASVMAGCAIIAYADGEATPDEQKRMLSLIHRFQPLGAFSRSDLANAFEQASGEFDNDRHEGERKALMAVRRICGQRRHAVMLLKTCQAIASADGIVDPREWHAMVKICRSLDLNPADHGLIDDGPSNRRAAS
jgi:tellurite resistance protein TerB